MGDLTTRDVLNEINLERGRQDAKWGEQNHPLVNPGIPDLKYYQIQTSGAAYIAKRACDQEADAGETNWVSILAEEVLEAAEQAALGDVPRTRAELIQVAAVAVAWVEAIDRGQK